MATGRGSEPQQVVRESRAFDALSLEEEKHAVLAKAHQILAARSRMLSVSRGGSDEGLIRSSRDDFWQLREELGRQLQTLASSAVRGDRETMKIALLANGLCFRYCSLALRNDPEVLLAAMDEWPPAVRHGTPELRGDPGAMLRAVTMDPAALEMVREELQHDKNFVLSAVRSRPASLAWASEKFRGDREVVLEALRRQTPKDVEEYSENLLVEVSESLRSDQEVVLEAARSSGDAVQFASSELRRDRDFLLQASRRAPQAEEVYQLADESVHKMMPMSHFLGASASVLAVAGDHAPVLTVSPTWLEQRQQGSEDSSKILGGFEVSLLSGATFSCTLPETDEKANEELGKAAEDLGGQESPSWPSCSEPSQGLAELQPAPKRQRTAATTEADAPVKLKMGQLAELVLTNLLQTIEVETLPRRIFILFTKKSGDPDGVQVTPWDWNRPLSEFL